jgi:hypothetical protein
MESIKQSTILHPILFAIFPIIFVYSQGLSLLPFVDFIIPIFLSISITLVLLVGVRFFLKNKIKSSLIISVFIFLSLNFNHLKNIIKSNELISQINDFYLVILYGILLIGISFYIIKSKRKLNNVTVITNTFAIILIIMVMIDIGSYNVERISIQESDVFVPNSNLKVSDSYGKPDVYVIVLDAYANHMILDKYFHYDNQKFLNELIEQGFFVSDEYSHSNYLLTDLTIPSFLNMDYVHNLVSSNSSEKLREEQLKKMASNNLVMQNFKEMGYQTIGIDSGWMGTRVSNISDDYLCETSSQFRVLSLLRENTIIRILENAIRKDLNQKLDSEFVYMGKVDVNHHKRQKVMCNFSELNSIPGKFSEPIFVYFHVLSPHTPWVFDENGKPPLQMVDSITPDIKKRQIAYVKEMEFINKKVIENTNKIILESKTEPIIIILSDHGTRIKADELTKDEKDIIGYGNLMAVYLPNDAEHSNYETTPVNIFRLVFNSYFNGSYEILENKVFYDFDEEFIDWEHKIINVLG